MFRNPSDMLVWPPSFKENICSVVLSHDVAECIIDKNMHKSKFSISSLEHGRDQVVHGDV